MVEFERNFKDVKLYTALSNPYLDLYVKKIFRRKACGFRKVVVTSGYINIGYRRLM